MKSNRLVVCMALMLLGAAVDAGAAPGIRGYVIANGGQSSVPSSNGSYRLYGTAGLPAIQRATSPASNVCSGFWCFGGPQVLDVDDTGTSTHLQFALGVATPNPSSGATHFSLTLPEAATVAATVYDVSGRQVGEVFSRRFEAGRHDLTWRPTNVRAGVYFLRLTTNGVLREKRTIVRVR